MQQITKPTEIDTFVRLSTMLKERIIPFSAPTLWRRVKDGSFPAPVKLSPGVSAWRLRDIEAWQRARSLPGSVSV